MAEKTPITIRLVSHGPVLPLVLSLGIGLMMMLMTLSAKRTLQTSDWMLVIGGALVVIAFGLAVYCWPMVDRRPRLILSERGVFAPRQSGVVVPWENVVAVIHRPKRGKQSALVVFDVTKIELPPPGRVRVASGRPRFGGTLSFWPEWLEGGWWRIREGIAEMAPGVKVEER